MNRITIIDNESGYNNNLIQHLRERRVEVYMKDPHDPISEVLEGSDGIIIGGGSIKGDKKKRNNVLSWYKGLIERSEIPILGICLGHLVIGLLYGGRYGRMREEGVTKNIRLRDFPLLESPEIRVYEDHDKGILRIGDESQLATYRDEISGSIEGLGIRGRFVYSVQFHPEIQGKEVIDGFLGLC